MADLCPDCGKPFVVIDVLYDQHRKIVAIKKACISDHNFPAKKL